MLLPSDADLLRTSHHLFYEIWMFYESGKYLKYDSRTDAVLTNVHLESFAIHGRALLNFFYFEAKQDDVIAEHYIKNWKSLCPPISEKLERISKRVGKEIAHLTYSRLEVTPETKGWDVGMEQEIHQVVKKFQENTPKHLVVEKLLYLRPEDRKTLPVPTSNARRLYTTNTST